MKKEEEKKIVLIVEKNETGVYINGGKRLSAKSKKMKLLLFFLENGDGCYQYDRIKVAIGENKGLASGINLLKQQLKSYIWVASKKFPGIWDKWSSGALLSKMIHADPHIGYIFKRKAHIEDISLLLEYHDLTKKVETQSQPTVLVVTPTQGFSLDNLIYLYISQHKALETLKDIIRDMSDGAFCSRECWTALLCRDEKLLGQVMKKITIVG